MRSHIRKRVLFICVALAVLGFISHARVEPADAAGEFSFPFDASVRFYFNQGPHDWDVEGVGSGIDLQSTTTYRPAHILAMDDGTIVAVTRFYEPGGVNCIGSSNGEECLAVTIDHDNGYTVTYVHLADFAPGLEDAFAKNPRIRVTRGTWIGTEGTTGAYAVHLHLELSRNGEKVTWDGVTIDGWMARSGGYAFGYIFKGQDIPSNRNFPYFLMPESSSTNHERPFTLELPATAPTDLTSSAVSATTARVSWAYNGPAATGFSIWRWNGTWTQVGATTGLSRSRDVSDLAAGSTQYFTVCAYNDSGGQCAAGYTSLVMPSASQPPNAPTNLTKGGSTASSITVAWSYAGPAVTSFLIYKWDGAAWQLMGTPGAAARAHTVGSLAPATSYYFAVCAINGAGGKCSSYALLSTEGAAEAPATPVLAAYPLNATTFRLNWTDVAGETGYEIWDGASIRTTGANVPAMDWGGFSPGLYKCFIVRAVNGGAASGWSNWSCQTLPASSGGPPPTPSRPTVVALNWSTIRVVWPDVAGETGYVINDGETSRTVGANATTYDWGGFSPGKYKCFTVRAFNSTGGSSWSEWNCTTTPG